MVKYKVAGRTYGEKGIYRKAKKTKKSIYGSQQAVEHLKKRGYKVKFFNTSTKRWNVA